MIRAAALAALVALAPAPVRDDPPAVDRVEEDWELVIRTTDRPADGPQMSTTMAPGGLAGGALVHFNLNYRERPDFRPGGLQIQAWSGDLPLTTASSLYAALQHDDETITWTQRLEVSAGTATYTVVSGQSTTWGQFGDEALTATFPAGADDLTGYDPQVSLSKSGVSWQSNHVTSMRLMRIRYYAGEDLVATYDTPRSVHPPEG